MNYPLLETAPNHLSPEFIDYLRDNNVVVYELDDWLVIENCKYHNKDGNKAWWTAFSKKAITHQNDVSYGDLGTLLTAMPRSWEVLIKATNNRSVKRFHVHFIER